jgi:4-amino-4-deoxy-L-arabinose transferase-like glycosyltransferase
LPWRFGPIVTLAIALPWYGLITLQQGHAFIDAFFGLHNVQRFTAVVNQHSGPWYYHFLILLPGMLPWSIALPAAIGQSITQAIKPVNRSPAQRMEHLGLFALIWFVTVMGFFAIATTKYMTYSLPAVPAAAILITLFWNQGLQAKSKWGLRTTIYPTLASFVVLAIGSWYCPNWMNSDPAMPTLGQVMADSGLAWVGAILWLVGVGFGLLYLGSWDFWRVKILVAAAFILLFITPTFSVLDQARQQPLRQIAGFIGQFHSQREVALMNRSAQIRPYLDKLKRDRRSGESMARSLLLVTTADALAEGNVLISEYELLQQVGIYQLVRIGLE